MKYFRHNSDYKGLHYFKVDEIGVPVVKITVGAPIKKGRPFCVGVTLISYNTFSTSYGHKCFSECLKPITKSEYESAFDLVMKKLK